MRDKSDQIVQPRTKTDRELDRLIAEITVDCYDEEEQLPGFETAFDEDADFECPGVVIGEDVEVLSVATRNNRRELIGTCRRGRRRYELALLDIDIHADPATSRLLGAYRRIPPLTRPLIRHHLNSTADLYSAPRRRGLPVTDAA